MEVKQKRLKYACYATNVCMSIVGNLSPLLFLTFRSLYGISYSLLGLLVLVNFVTQLLVDLAFSFFSHKFNIAKAVKFTPILTAIGLVIYALSPWITPNAVYVGLLIGTLIFSSASGFAEVLISPVIAALPSENPEREMSKLHSVYAWGVVIIVLFCTLFLLIFKSKNWQFLPLILTVIPLVASILFSGTAIPKMQTPEKTSGALTMLKDKRLLLSVFAIFLGGASECTMAQWCSGYLEQGLGVPKALGDVFGVALFAVALGLGRTLYANKGKNIEKILLIGSIGATICYFVASVSPFALIGLLACALTGFCTSMLWPGNLIVAENRCPKSGVFLFAMMAAGGDLGASVGPQLVGLITDFAIANPSLVSLSETLLLTPEQFGMKLGMLVGMIFPLLSIFVCLKFIKTKNKD
ncbi:MAG: MFS transporter [Clostridiales bacterium]|nr:MFS transporter [Clostridiales bacterium]